MPLHTALFVRRTVSLLALCGLLLNPGFALAQNPAQRGSDPAAYVPKLWPAVSQSSSELRDTVDRFSVDRFGLGRRYNVELSPERNAKFRAFYRAWQAHLAEIDFNALSVNARIDYLLLKNRLWYEIELITREEKRLEEAKPLMPFAGVIVEFFEVRRRMEPVHPAAAAATLSRLAEEIDKTRRSVRAALRPDGGGEAIKTTKIIAFRASELLTGLGRNFEQWYRYYAGYDPLFSWWASAPYKKADEALKAYIKTLREDVVGIRQGEDEPIIGDPIGREALLQDLAAEMISYSPEELVVLAEREFAWCEAEMLKASREMGFGDDWKKALEKVKTLHVEPGKQSDLIRDLAFEAAEFVKKRDLVTVPPLAEDIWRIEMMSPERQKVNPFFLGGEVIQVSFPTDTMAHEDKLMSMRGNNIHFARATVHHELIPGHHLQGFMSDRYNTHRRAFSTPFWGEGWALYWEMLLWDLNFQRSPEDRVGMLFWRMHRAARIIFSLSFHLGTMTPQQCIDFLVDRVGHERANATAEVRRSFIGNYSPLYQAAYMLGGLQFRALHKDLVQSGRMTNRQFHDAILQGNRIPVEMVRAMLTNQQLTRDHTAQWKFYGTNLVRR